MELTAQSEVGKLRKVILRTANSAFGSPAKIASEWELLRFSSAPDFVKADQEYKQFASILQFHGAEILYLDQNESQTLDSIYCRDAAIMTDQGVIICNMGKSARNMEPARLGELAQRVGVSILGHIVAPGTVEGGDVCWLDRSTLAVGYSYRTNAYGIQQLEAILKPYDISVLRVDLPHYLGSQDVFHLMSIFSPVSPDLAVVYSPLMPVSFRNALLERSVTLIEVPQQEFESMGCNVLALEPGKCVMLQGNPRTQECLETHGCNVVTYAGEEISKKGGGGPTCLTRPIYREIPQ